MKTTKHQLPDVCQTYACRCTPAFRSAAVLICLALLLVATQSTRAAWTLLDNFDGYATGATSTATTNSWSGVFVGTGNANIIASDQGKSLQTKGGAAWRGNEKNITGTAGVPVNALKTIFFQFKPISTGGNFDVMMGLAPSVSNIDENNAWQDFSVMPFFAGGACGVADLKATRISPAGDVELITNPACGTWYNVWLVVSNNAVAPYYEVWTSTGTNAGTLALANAAFRNLPINQALNAIGFMAAGGAGSEVLHDNIYYTDGKDTSNPLMLMAGNTILSPASPVAKDVTVTASATFTGGLAPLAYQWQSSSDDSTWSSITDATNSTYQPDTSAAGTTYYRVIVTDSFSPAQVVTNASAELVVLAVTAPSVSAEADTASATRNQAVTITAEVTPGSGTVTDVSVNLTPIGGSASASLVWSNANIYTNTFTVDAGTSLGAKSLVVTVTDDTPLFNTDSINLTVVAANQVWDGEAGDDNWSSNPNWENDSGPGLAGDSVTFAGTTRLTPDMNASYAVTGVTFDASAGSFTLGTSTSSTLTNGAGGIVNNSANPQTINVPVVLSAAQSLNAAVGDLAFGGAVVNGASALALPGASDVTFSGSLSGTADFNKTGAGTLTIGGSANAGQFNLDKGTVNLTGTMTAAGVGQRIRVGNGAGNLGVLNVESGAVATANWSLVAGSDTSTGVINVNGGTLIHQGGLEIYLGSGGSGSTGILNLNSGTLSNRINGIIIGESGASVGAYNQSGGLGLLGTNIVVGQTANTNQFNISGGTATAVNLFVGSGNGAGTATLSGGTLSLGGIARVANGANASSTGTGLLTVSNTAVLNVENDLVLGFAGAGNLGRMVIEGGTVNVASTATRWLILGQWDTTRGQLDINGGQLNLNAGTSLKYSIGGGGTASTNVVNLNGGGITFFSDNGATVGGGGMVDLAQSGSANARNTFNLNGGTLTTPGVGASSTTPTRLFNFNGGTLKAAANSAAFLQGLSRANVRDGGAVIDTDNFAVTIAQALLHSDIGGDAATDGGLTKLGAGTLTLSGASTYTGDTTVSDGTLLVTGSIGSGAVSVESGATLGGTGTIGGAVEVAAGGTFAPGTSIGTLTLNNSLTLAGNTVLEINKAAGPVLTSDLVTGITTLNSGGTVTVIATGDGLAAGDEFTVFNAGAFNGAFTSITPAPGAGLAWDTTKLAAEGKLLVHANPVAGADQAGAMHGETIQIAVSKLLANDTGETGEVLSITGVGANASLGGGFVSYTAPSSGETDVIQYTLSDGRGGTATGLINVALSNGAGNFNRVSINTLGNGDVALTYLGIPGTNYTLEVTHDLVEVPVVWTPLQTKPAGPNGLLIFTNTPSLAPTNDFYRTRYVP